MKRKYQTNWILKIILLVLISLSAFGCGPEKDESITVGVINLAPVLEPVFESFKAQMAELGYVEGENIAYIYGGPAGGEWAATDIHDNDLVAGDQSNGKCRLRIGSNQRQ